MPMHDWTKTDAGNWHDFHQSWTVLLKGALNNGVLPEGFYAQVERKADGKEPDLLTFHAEGRSPPRPDGDGGLALLTKVPVIQSFIRDEKTAYADRANRVTVATDDGEVVAVIEMVSPGNKSSRVRFREFVEKTVKFIERGVHVLIVDPFEPGSIGPEGVHSAVWEAFGEDPAEFNPDKPLVNVSYLAGDKILAAVDCIAVGDTLPVLPLFLGSDFAVETPLESSYMAAWKMTALPIRRKLEAAAS